MSRFISIDWDHDQLSLVTVTGGRGGLRINKALSWRQPHSLSPAEAKTAGESLRQHLKAARIASAPVLACLGRERVIFKEIRYPAVAESEEAALVRFQATKELSQPADRVNVDYCPLPREGGNGNNRAIVSIAEKPWVQSLQALCDAAGLKLVAVTPRPFGIASCVQHLAGASEISAPPPSADATVAAVVLSGAWAEFSIIRNEIVLFARTLSAGEELYGEVRRNLTLFSGQAQVAAGKGDPVQALYFAGDEEYAVVRERLEEMLAIPVHTFDPFSGEEHMEVDGQRAAFTGAVGLAQLWAAREKAPINFVQPKQGEVKKSSGRLPYLIAAAAALVLLVCGFAGGNWVLSSYASQLEEKQTELVLLDGQINRLKPELKKADQVRQWHDRAIPWIDELQELTARFPKVKDFRINKIVISEISNPKDKFTMQMKITGVSPARRIDALKSLVYLINEDKCCRAKAEHKTRKDRGSGDMKDFTLTVVMVKEPMDLSKVNALPAQKSQSAVKKSTSPRRGPGRFGRKPRN